MSLAMQLRSTGAADEIVPVDVEVEAPGPGHVRVRHDAIGVNFIDMYHRRGTFPLAAMPAVLGLEGAGTIESVGTGVGEFRVGDRVAYLADTSNRGLGRHGEVVIRQSRSTEASARGVPRSCSCPEKTKKAAFAT